MATEQGVTITWLGHAATRIDTGDGRVILLDPWLQTNPKVPDDQKNQPRVDLMLISHAHADHMADAVPVAKAAQPDVIVIKEIADYLEAQGVVKTNGMNKGGTVHWNGVDITRVDAVHSSGFMENDIPIQLGSPAGYVLRFSDGFTLYFAGDTDVFESMRTIGELYKPDLAMLPIGDHFTMGPRQAAHAIRLLGVKRVIPIHYGTFPLLTGTPEALEQEASDVAGLEVIALQPGESMRSGKVLSTIH